MAETSPRWAFKDVAAAPANAAAPVMASAAPVEAPPAPMPAPLTATGAAVTESPATPAPPKPIAESPAAAKSAAKPTEKAESPPASLPMDPDEYRRIEALLYHVLEMLGGSQPFNVAVLAETERIGRRLQQEVTSQFGKAVYTIVELEKKGVVLRQKHDLAQSLLQVVERSQLALGFRGKRREFLQTAVGGVVTAMISALCAVLAVRTVLIDSLLTNPSPNLLELLRASLNPESLVPFLGFQMIASLLGLFTLFAIYRCWYLRMELHELKRAMQAKHIDPSMITRLP